MARPDADQLYGIAERQGGYFTARQAGQAGFSWERLSYYAKTGLFKRVAHGIYRLTRFPSSPHEDLFLAQLRTGPNSVVSHESALSLYGLSDVLPTVVHMTVPRTASRRRQGIRLHTNRIEPSETTSREGLSVTSLPRTIADLARSGLPEEHVFQALDEAVDRGLLGSTELRATAERYGGRSASIIQRFLNGEHL